MERLNKKKKMKGGMMQTRTVPSLQDLTMKKLINHYIDLAIPHLTRLGTGPKAFYETIEELKDFVLKQLRVEEGIANTTLEGEIAKKVAEEVEKRVRDGRSNLYPYHKGLTTVRISKK